MGVDFVSKLQFGMIALRDSFSLFSRVAVLMNKRCLSTSHANFCKLEGRRISPLLHSDILAPCALVISFSSLSISWPCHRPRHFVAYVDIFTSWFLFPESWLVFLIFFQKITPPPRVHSVTELTIYALPPQMHSRDLEGLILCGTNLPDCGD